MRNVDKFIIAAILGAAGKTTANLMILTVREAGVSSKLGSPRRYQGHYGIERFKEDLQLGAHYGERRHPVGQERKKFAVRLPA